MLQGAVCWHILCYEILQTGENPVLVADDPKTKAQTAQEVVLAMDGKIASPAIPLS